MASSNLLSVFTNLTSHDDSSSSFDHHFSIPDVTELSSSNFCSEELNLENNIDFVTPVYVDMENMENNMMTI